MTGWTTSPLAQQSLSTVAHLAETAGGGEQLLKLLTAEVGHTDSETVYEENKLTLRRYAPETVRHRTPILIVYALVNRPYILDLQPDRSVIRRLLAAGFEVYLIDWGEPSRLDQSLTLADYLDRYVDNCLETVCDRTGTEAVHLLGYCMGGTMSIMYAATHPDRVRTLTLLATPVAFEGNGGILEQWAAHCDPETTVDALGNVPAELLAFTFSMMNPVESYVTKYVRLVENIDDDDFVENFARMERWIWDGVDVAGETFREFVTEIYRENSLVEGEFVLGDRRVDPGEIRMPVQQIVGEYDHIVPPESSTPLNDAIGSRDERVVAFPAGHIGISVSGTAHEELWPDVCEWLADRDASVETVRGIGPTYAGRLDAAGIETVADLRAHGPAELAAIAETTPERAERWLTDGQ